VWPTKRLGAGIKSQVDCVTQAMRISIGMSIKAYKASVYFTESVAMYNVLEKMIDTCASRPDHSPVVSIICAHLPGRI